MISTKHETFVLCLNINALTWSACKCLSVSGSVNKILILYIKKSTNKQHQNISYRDTIPSIQILCICSFHSGLQMPAADSSLTNTANAAFFLAFVLLGPLPCPSMSPHTQLQHHISPERHSKL